jgi:hypothetical protein
MDDALRERIEALERAVTDGDHDLSALADDARALDRLDTVEDRVEDIETRVEELEAATQALRGYVGNIRSVNQDVEKRADAALAKAESLEATMAGSDPATPDRDSSGDHSMGTDKRVSATHQQADDSTSHGQSRMADHKRTSATPDGGLASTPNGRQTTGGRQRCHACGHPHTSDEHERTRTTGVTDSLTAQSALDNSSVDEGGSVSDGDLFAGEERDDVFGDRAGESEDCEDLVPENDPLVSDDDETGGLRRLRELL